MGLAGAFLLITGLVYAVIGIKNKWIYVFGSAAYLTALAVTVLIVYLMNPPVSDGVQGAFFVAAFFTGLIFGGLALVFSDLTEGFGCLLGGFCLSMWFLSLKEGGLISSSTGRAIFIGCMSAAGYSLSFSHYTRNYGLIGSISFSGATAAMLGVDCLARAGWKEFWLYLWSLNDDIFPLNTNTYPVTKNMKAELAGVVIIAVFGVISQLRVWNLVKARREKNAAQELEKQQETDREEEERGRTVEDKFQKERAQWEATYGNKSMPDSSDRSSSFASPKGSTSIREKEIYGTDSVEMVSLSKGGVAAAGTTVTVNVLRDDDIRQIDERGNPIPQHTAMSKSGASMSEHSVPGDSDTASGLAKKPSVIHRTDLRSSVPPPPAVVPLPFTVPAEEDANSGDEDNTSVSAVPESHYEAERNPKPMSKRISDMSITRRFSKNRVSRAFSESSEALVENDRASSIAATLDNDHDNISIRDISPARSPILDDHVVSTDSNGGDPVTDSDRKESDDDALDADIKRPAFRQSLTASTDPKPKAADNKRASLRDSRVRADTLVGNRSGSELGEQEKSYQGSQNGRTESHVGSLQEGGLPSRLSKVALSYRTNEWAKHLETAEKPHIEDLTLSAPPNVIYEEVPEEKAAPVSDEIAAPLLGSKRQSKRASMDSAYINPGGLDRSASTFSQNSLVEQRTLTQPGPAVLSRPNSAAQSHVLAPLPTNTLLGRREDLMRKRTSSQSITPGSSATNLLELADQESMSLAQRRQILQYHQTSSPPLQHQLSSASQKRSPPSTSQKWQNKGWATKGAPSGFDSHQPKRTSSSQSDQKREELYANWRSNVRDVTPPQTQAYMAEQQRAALINERRQKEAERQQRAATQQQRASQLDSMMRSGHMLDAHREAMRKMQANANRHAS
ncbi:hypothetical protein DE146DRAFT_321257 [Phaeosphaeria sp. MPI-PUGE-AT-0046c]|nr:hypothetical protein DE146DRAFT_321257 [Phaeosphaeria sp. MPI-PUGE-AT-0046c]